MKVKVKFANNQLVKLQNPEIIDQRTVFNEYLMSRTRLINKLTDPRRDIDVECGYLETEPDITIYRQLYDRDDIAARVVNVYPDECWSVYPEVYEKEDLGETMFEEAWERILFEHNIWSYCHRVDELSGIGSFGGMLFGFDDGRGMQEPVDGLNVMGKRNPTVKEKNLTFIRCFDESVIKINSYQTNPRNARYGMPETYLIDVADPTSGAGSASVLPPSRSMVVHWSRVLHVADNRKNSEIFGQPRIKPVLNRLQDLKKILGGSAEMFWKGAFFGLSIETLPEILAQTDVDVDQESIKQDMYRYMNKLQRYILLNGMTAKPLTPQVADPSSHIEQQIQAICITLGVPYRIFLGSEAAHLASTQDVGTWNKRLRRRQTVYLNPCIINPLVRRLQDVGVLPRIDRWHVSWTDLNALSDKDKADVALKKAQAILQYTTGGCETAMSMKDFWTKIIGFSNEEAEAIVESRTKAPSGMATKPVWDQPASGAFGSTKSATAKPARNSLGAKKKKPGKNA